MLPDGHISFLRSLTSWTISSCIVCNKETRYWCLKNDSVSLKQQLTHGPEIAYFPRNESAMNQCLLWRSAEGVKKRRMTWKTVGRSVDVLLDTVRPAGPDIRFLPLLWTGTIVGRWAGSHARLSISSALLRKLMRSQFFLLAKLTYCDGKESDWHKVHLQIYWRKCNNKPKQTVRGISKVTEHISSFTNEKIFIRRVELNNTAESSRIYRALHMHVSSL